MRAMGQGMGPVTAIPVSPTVAESSRASASASSRAFSSSASRTTTRAIRRHGGRPNFPRSASSSAANASKSCAAASLMAGASGWKVWTMARPASAPRPHRPLTWLTSWKVRSAARKSGRLSAVSALTTPTSRTPGKSRPLAIICVPTRSFTSPRPKRPSASWKSAASCMLSASMRSMVSPATSDGWSRESSSSTRCTPSPNTETCLPQLGQLRGRRCSPWQWWQRTYCVAAPPFEDGSLWQIIPASHRSQRIIQPQRWSAHAIQLA